MQAPSVTLNNAVTIPIIGLGTWQSKGQDCYKAVSDALEIGYKHIDTALVYNNHAQIAQAIKDAKFDRSKLFITSKLPPMNQGYQETLDCFQQCLTELETDYLDCFLIHWPGVAKTDPSSPKNAEKRKESWIAMEKLYREGKVRAIGVSNYYENHLEDLFTYCSIPPTMNQIEFHPWLYKKSVQDWCKTKNITIEAYSPLGLGKLLTDPIVTSIAQECSSACGEKVTEAYVLLNWSVQQGCIVLPKSVHKDRIEANFNAVVKPKVALSAEQMQKLSAMNKDCHVCWNPTDIK
jgi:diketogulonate reductase-like aldo/keto reductase